MIGLSNGILIAAEGVVSTSVISLSTGLALIYTAWIVAQTKFQVVLWISGLARLATSDSN